MCPPFTQMGSMVSPKKKRKNKKKEKRKSLVSWSGAEEPCAQDKDPPLPKKKKKHGPIASTARPRCQEEAPRAQHVSLLCSAVLVAIQTQINRGGPAELMIEEGGGGVAQGGLCALQLGALKSAGAQLSAHTRSQLRTGLLTVSHSPAPLSSVLLHTGCLPPAWPQDTFFSRRELGQLLAALSWSCSLFCLLWITDTPQELFATFSLG